MLRDGAHQALLGDGVVPLDLGLGTRDRLLYGVGEIGNVAAPLRDRLLDKAAVLRDGAYQALLGGGHVLRVDPCLSFELAQLRLDRLLDGDRARLEIGNACRRLELEGLHTFDGPAERVAMGLCCSEEFGHVCGGGTAHRGEHLPGTLVHGRDLRDAGLRNELQALRRCSFEVGAALVDPGATVGDRLFDRADVAGDRALHRLRCLGHGPLRLPTQRRDLFPDCRDPLVHLGETTGDRLLDLGPAGRGRPLDLVDMTRDRALHRLRDLGHGHVRRLT